MKYLHFLVSVLMLAFSINSSYAVTVGVDGQLFYSGGVLNIRNEFASSGANNYTYLRAPFGGDQFLFIDNGNQFVSFSEIELAAFGIDFGEELLFSIRPNNGGTQFFTGASARNPDGRHHANVVDLGSAVFQVGFEDLVGGGDQDFNDAVFRVLSGGLPDPNLAPQTVPEPTTLVLLGLGLAGLGFTRCRSRIALV